MLSSYSQKVVDPSFEMFHVKQMRKKSPRESQNCKLTQAYCTEGSKSSVSRETIFVCVDWTSLWVLISRPD